MVNNIYKLYPQFTHLTDRRQNNDPVEVDRRSGIDRRSGGRTSVDVKLEKDINRAKEVFAPFLNDAAINKNQDQNSKNTLIRKTVLAALSPITPIRRVNSLPDNINDKNYIRAAGLAALAIINLPEDKRDLEDAVNQIKGKYSALYDPNEYQHTFSFFKGTLLEGLLKIPGQTGEKIADILQKFDITIFRTKFGKLLTNLLKIDLDGPPLDYGKTYGKDVPIFAYKFKGNIIQKTVGRALLRIPLLSVLTLSALELPAIIKAYKCTNKSEEKRKNGLKQIFKSVIYLASIFTGIGLSGALIARKGPTGSLIGMGVGATAGSIISNYANKKIDKGI